MTPKTKQWKTLSTDDQGSAGSPGTSYTISEATVQTNGTRYRLLITARWGSNQGYLEEHGNNDRQYRADSLDELMRIALAAEKERTKPHQEIMTAIRAAIYAAEDSAE